MGQASGKDGCAVWADNAGAVCEGCSVPFGLVCRKHHCRECGGLVCSECSRGRRVVGGYDGCVRVCRDCVSGVKSMKQLVGHLVRRGPNNSLVLRSRKELRTRLLDKSHKDKESVALAKALKKEHEKMRRASSSVCTGTSRTHDSMSLPTSGREFSPSPPRPGSEQTRRAVAA
eukprot:Hpha_TRINITY_DN15478_c1_g1::TRINITY_DN15478_c1_g1_i1::g.174215::m.174215